ncbi:hypothetical protein R6Q59_006468 [Mikania micrantha]
MVPTLEKLIDRYVAGLPSCLQSIVLAANPATLESAIALSAKLTGVMVKSGVLKDDTGKSKETTTTKKPEQHQTKKKKVIGSYAVATSLRQAPAIPVNTAPKNYVGMHPQCTQCKFQHPATVQCRQCNNCGRLGHRTQQCRALATQTVNNAAVAMHPPQNPGNLNNNHRGCYNCGEFGHFSRDCPKRVQRGAPAPRGRAFMIGAAAARQDPATGTGM